MKVFICPRPGEIGKFRGVVNAFSDIWDGGILDVGCRSRNLKQVLSDHNRNRHSRKFSYVGFDLYSPSDVIGNIETGLPFHEQAFDVVVALDLLEHTNDIHKAFKEVCRVARRFVVLTFPNLYDIKGRMNFLFGYPLSGKYGLPECPLKDRHRWFFSLREAVRFVHAMASQCGFKAMEDGCLIGPRRGFAPWRFMVCLLPNLLSPCYIALLERKRTG